MTATGVHAVWKLTSLRTALSSALLLYCGYRALKYKYCKFAPATVRFREHNVRPRRTSSLTVPLGPVTHITQITNLAVITVQESRIDEVEFLRRLSQALSKYPWFSGRLSRTNGQPVVEVTHNSSVHCRFIDSLEYVWEYDTECPPPVSVLNKYVRHLDTSLMKPGPCLDITVTLTKKHSIIGFCWNHAVGDGQTIHNFFAAFGDAVEDRQPAAHESTLTWLSQQPLAVDQDKYPKRLAKLPCGVFLRMLLRMFAEKRVFVQHRVYPLAFCSELKRKVNMQLCKVPPDQRFAEFCSTLDCLTVIAWREMARACFADQTAAPETVFLGFWIDVRENIGAAKEMAGNPMLLAVVSQTTEVLLHGDIGPTAALVRREIIRVKANAAAKLSQGYVTFDLLQSFSIRHAHEVAHEAMKGTLFQVSSWTTFDFSVCGGKTVWTSVDILDSLASKSGLPGNRQLTFLQKFGDSIVAQSIL